MAALQSGYFWMRINFPFIKFRPITSKSNSQLPISVDSKRCTCGRWESLGNADGLKSSFDLEPSLPQGHRFVTLPGEIGSFVDYVQPDRSKVEVKFVERRFCFLELRDDQLTCRSRDNHDHFVLAQLHLSDGQTGIVTVGVVASDLKRKSIARFRLDMLNENVIG